MPQKPEVVLEALRKGYIAPIYFLQGDEAFFIDQISDFIEKNALAEHEKGFNQVICYGKDVTVGAVITQARRFPMMAERQVVIVKEAQEMGDLNAEKGQQLLESYIQKPVPSTILVFAHKHKTVDGRKAWIKLLDKTAVLVECKKLYDDKIPGWTNAYVQSKGYRLQPKAAQMLADSIGNNLSRLTNEVDKLLINFPPKTEITPDHVHQFVGISKEYNVFELQNALVKKDVLKANRIVGHFGANPKENHPLLVVAALFTFFTKLLLLHQQTDRSEAGVAKALSISPFFAKDYLQAAQAFPLQKVARVIHALRVADLQAKGVDAGSMDEEAILRELVFKILH
jgi:DNA polymerase-3 subunit delta